VIEINNKQAKLWSRIGTRASYGLAMLEVAKANPNIIAMSADLGSSSGLNQLILKYPEQFVNIGIAEQNMIGVAAGMTREGFQVFASSLNAVLICSLECPLIDRVFQPNPDHLSNMLS